MSTILGDLGDTNFMATEHDWHDYQELLAKLRAHPLGETMTGEPIVPARNRPGKRTRNLPRQGVRE